MVISYICECSSVWLEHSTDNGEVVGSSPTIRTIFCGKRNKSSVKFCSMVSIWEKDVNMEPIFKKSNVRVGLAGPGTGKTHYFKQLADSSQFKGKNILILSFINKLVNDLKEDFKDYKDVEVSTLHSFAHSILRGKLKSGDAIDVSDYIDNVLSEDFSYIKDRECDYSTKFQEYVISKEEIEFYKDRKSYYETKNRKGINRVYSHDSIMYNIGLILSRDVTKIPKYDLILVDEFQDFNKLECELIKILSLENRIVIVGDDDQSLYDFKKARPDEIRKLYRDNGNENFTLPECHRCTKVVVDATNDIIKNAKKMGFLKERLDKEYKYPKKERPEKDEISNQFNKVEIKNVSHDSELYNFLEREIINNPKKKILILNNRRRVDIAQKMRKEKGLNLVNVDLIKTPKKDTVKFLGALKRLVEAKTDNFSIRMVLNNLFGGKREKELIKKSNEGKKIYNLLEEEEKTAVEELIEVYKKGTKTKDSNKKDQIKLVEKLNIPLPINQILNGTGESSEHSANAKIMSPLLSKGLSADYVFYFIDDFETASKVSGGKESYELTDDKICEFLVGVTRTKERLVLIKTKTKSDPLVLDLIESSRLKYI